MSRKNCCTDDDDDDVVVTAEPMNTVSWNVMMRNNKRGIIDSY